MALVGGRLWFGGPSTAQDATSQRDPEDPRQSLRRQALCSTSSSLLVRGASNLLEPRGEKVHTNHSNCGVAISGGAERPPARSRTPAGAGLLALLNRNGRRRRAVHTALGRPSAAGPASDPGRAAVRYRRSCGSRPLTCCSCRAHVDLSLPGYGRTPQTGPVRGRPRRRGAALSHEPGAGGC